MFESSDLNIRSVFSFGNNLKSYLKGKKKVKKD